MRKKTKEVIRRVGYLMAVVAAVCGGIAIATVCLTRKWFVKSWGDVSIEELVFQLKVPLETSLTEELQNLFQYVVPSVIIWGIILLIVMISIRVHRFVAGVLGFCILCSSFPEKKRNLIYIFLESMENTYMSKLDGGAYDINYIPELTALAEENLNFSHTDQVGGAYEVEGIRWTVASMFAQTSGLPLLIPIARNAMNGQEVFFPKVWSLGNILEQEGYQQELLIGSDAIFGGRLQYFSQHGSYKIYDYSTALINKKFPIDYRVWWGYEDQRLFEYAKEEITKLAAEEEPFNFTMLTVDTHKENGWPCPLCRWEYGADQYGTVLSCSSRQVADFVSWIRQQEFYKDTTVILSGDHRTMDADFCSTIDPDYRRTLYNTILNSPIEAEETTFRKFTAMDMFPTTLASLGVEIEGNQLGLGTNLYSGEKTLAEQIGVHKLSNALKTAKDESEFWRRFTEEIVVPEEAQ
ncbi:MAG: LTA synthase family protein [Lachnospiraceae bacterium]|nr:LTA synthase family protein [Lachnospiraceae bacterium]